MRRVSRCPVSVQPSFCCYFLGCVFAAHKSGEKRQGTAEDRVLFEFVGGSVLTNSAFLHCVAFVLSRNLKKAVTFLRQKRRTGHKCFLAHHTYPIFTHTSQLVCTVICDKLPWGRFAIFRCFRWVCGCWGVCVLGVGVFVGVWVLRAVLGFTPVLDCFVVLAVGVFSCAQAQHTHSVRTHRQSVVLSPRSFD